MFNHESPPIIVVVVIHTPRDGRIDRTHIWNVVAAKAIGMTTAGIIFAAHGALLSSVDRFNLP
jgi:hypothetical protein